MSCEQIRLQVPPKLFGVCQQMDRTDDQAVNSRLLVWRQRMHRSQRCDGKLAELRSSEVKGLFNEVTDVYVLVMNIQ